MSWWLYPLHFQSPCTILCDLSKSVVLGLTPYTIFDLWVSNQTAYRRFRNGLYLTLEKFYVLESGWGLKDWVLDVILFKGPLYTRNLVTSISGLLIKKLFFYLFLFSLRIQFSWILFVVGGHYTSGINVRLGFFDIFLTYVYTFLIFKLVTVL